MKRPKQKEVVNVKKQPKFQSAEKSADGILWSFSILDREGPFGWSKFTSLDKLLEIIFKKKDIEKTPWNDLHRAGSHGVELHRLCKEARERLAEIKLDDLDELFSLRISGTNRIWCIRQQNVLRILWWDPDHLVCPSLLKHT